MKLTPDGIILRDELMFRFAFDNKVPIVMVLSGGYQMNNARVIADSITNLVHKFKLIK